MGDDVGAPVLVVGHERSGTTWVGRVLASTPGTSYLGEPDHPRLGAFANRAVQGLGSHPVLGAADPAPADYARLWDVAFGAPVRIVRGQGRLSAALFAGTSDDERFAASHPLHPRVTARLRAAQITAVPRNRAGDFSSRIVKSVRAQLALDWICARWSPTVVVCRRHPLDVVASALAVDIESGLDWLAPAAHARARVFGVTEPVAGDRVACMAWRVGYLTSALDAYVAAHRDVVVVDHEDLCRAPVDGFRDLAVALGLEWTAGSERFLAAHDRPGVGFTMDRVAADQPGKWRARLLPAEARTAAEVLAQFPVGRTYELPV